MLLLIKICDYCRLDLNAWINDPPSTSSAESEDEHFEDDNIPNIFLKADQEKDKKYEEPSEEDLEKVIYFSNSK